MGVKLRAVLLNVIPTKAGIHKMTVTPWPSHGVQKKIKKDWIPRSSRGMILEVNGFLLSQE
ncbi:hypothetical protein A3305_05270 [Rickettsia amblyommatis]|uniref:Uncharacterized protein n=2 Tax=spotted fever group TaxID=114277 RepID=A0A9N7AUH7_RICCR|nr:hypothetical protein UQ52_02690 [Rickettsia conorii subsp. raoultii]ALA61707.1 hypothetical protein AL573_03140 [Rickettsia amblyommatis]APZ29945.1 hypothetical protein RRIM16_02895 [Rickettsia conorii subsp. raoultii]ARD87824.1 hypothetical protein A3305_05270 [Rickettsia amblyommatis]